MGDKKLDLSGLTASQISLVKQLVLIFLDMNANGKKSDKVVKLH